MKREVSGSGVYHNSDEFIALPAIYKNPDAFVVKSFCLSLYLNIWLLKSEISNSDDIKMWKVPNEFYGMASKAFTYSER
ncbi:MAG: hypothetical protein IPN46_12790 [Saprospiraceae bacterium]|nr:hypothetical protein [Saprospiraceae bacterium]